MNKHRYRIIFSKARGTWMAVAEIVRSRGKSASKEVSENNQKESESVRLFKARPSVTITIMVAMWLADISSASAEIVADSSASYKSQPTVISSANGTPQINIQRPNGAGLSHNRYSRFDVDTKGAILNNAQTPVKTELAGWINGNPNLTNGSARIILNEVNAAEPSYLQGFIEVAGNRAQVIVANPAGITCSGCGFINANRATLTTGYPLFEQETLKGFSVQEGWINIEGEGLNNTDVDYTDIIARAVEVNAGVWANNLNLVSGINDVTVEGSVQNIHGTKNESPAFAIDVKELGGMYAGKILMIGTEEGVGVRNSGFIGASAGELVITANGKLINTNKEPYKSASGFSINDDQNGNTGGTILASGELALSVNEVSNNDGLIQTNDNLIIRSQSITNDGRIQAMGVLDLKSNHMENLTRGAISANLMGINITESLINSGLINGRSIDIRSDHIDNIDTGQIYGDYIAITSLQIDNRGSNDKAATIAARNRLDIATQQLLNRQGALLFSAGDLSIGSDIGAAGDVYGKAESINNESATIEALSKLNIASDKLHNKNINFVTKEEHILVDEHHHERQWINNEDYYAFDFMRNTYEEVMVSSDPARLLSGAEMTLHIDTLVNDKSHILSGGNLNADIGSLQNLEGVLERREVDRGTAWFSWVEYCGSLGKSKCRRETPHTPYAPADTITSITLPLARFESDAKDSASGMSFGMLSGIDNDTGSLQLPSASLYQIHPEPTRKWLVETDPRFAGYREWISSDYMLSLLGLDPAATQKRLGDGFYEQRLIQQQIVKATGSRYLAGHQDDEEQFKALMNAGVSFAEEYNLRPGVELSAEQMAHLTSDIVWLVERDVLLSDGSWQSVLVSKLYALPASGDLNGQGALLGGRNSKINVVGNILNQGTLLAEQSLAVSAFDIDNQRGTIAADAVTLSSKMDINNKAGTMHGNNLLSLRAERDISIASATRESVNNIDNSQFEKVHLDGVGILRVNGDSGILTAVAGRDLILDSAHVINSGDSGATELVASNQINLGTTVTRRRDAIVWDALSYLTNGHEQEKGTQIKTASELRLLAGTDFTVKSGSIRSDDKLTMHAGGDIKIDAGMEEIVRNRRQYISKSGLFSSKQTIDESRSTVKHVLGSTLSANRVDMSAGDDLTIAGSMVVGDADVSLDAEGDISIHDAMQTSVNYGYHQEKKKGLMTSGIGIAFGKREQSIAQNTYSTTSVASTIGSVEGDVIVDAGATYSQRGSELLAPDGNIGISAGNIDIAEAQNSISSYTESLFKQSGLTISLSSPVINAAQTIKQLSESAQNTNDSRMKALAIATASMTAQDAYSQLKMGQGSTLNGRQGQIKAGKTSSDGSVETRDATLLDKIGGVSLNIGIGSDKYQSSTREESHLTSESLVQAGDNIKLVSVGGPSASDIRVSGSEITAGRSIYLESNADISLLGAQSSYTRKDNNRSSNSSLGVRIGLGSGSAGLAFTASSSHGRGHMNAVDVTYKNTQVTANDIVKIASGSDTTLKGAKVEGNHVVANVGGSLHIESLQDHSHYDSRQLENSGNLSVGAGVFRGFVDTSRLNAQSSYLSVTQPSGIKAGVKGFDVSVQDNTTLIAGQLSGGEGVDGGIMSSFTTGTIEVENLKNIATANAKASGFSLSNGMLNYGKYGFAKALLSNSQLDAQQDSASHGATRSVISGGDIHVTNELKQLEWTGSAGEEIIDLFELGTDHFHKASSKLDAAMMVRTVEGERKIKQGVYALAEKYSDEAYRTIFVKDHPFYEVLRADTGEPVTDTSTGKPKLRLLSEEEKKNLVPGADGRVNVFTNGIFNDEGAAGNSALQMSETPAGDIVYLIHFPEAERALSELMVAGYQYYLESTSLGGVSKSAEEVINVMERYGAEGLNLTGHSRGSMTIGNAMEVLEKKDGNSAVLLDTNIRLVGPAYNAQKAAKLLYKLSDGYSAGVELQNHADDFVGGWIGRNPATYDKRPDGSSSFKEAVKMFGDVPTVHSCYGATDTNYGCTKAYGKASTLYIQSN